MALLAINRKIERGNGKMNWDKVCDKLRAASDQHAKTAQDELLRGNKNMMEKHHLLSEIFYGLHAAIEAGLPAKD